MVDNNMTFPSCTARMADLSQRLKSASGNSTPRLRQNPKNVDCNLGMLQAIESSNVYAQDHFKKGSTSAVPRKNDREIFLSVSCSTILNQESSCEEQKESVGPRWEYLDAHILDASPIGRRPEQQLHVSVA